MDYAVSPIDRKRGETLDRRSFLRNAGLGALALTTVGGVAGMAREVLADEVTPAAAKETTFEYVESQLGIDYKTIADSPLDAILSQGEQEFLEKATPVFGDETKDAWKEMSAEVGTGSISEYTIKDLREFTPEMLTKFAAGLDPQDPKYGGLWSVGNLFIAEKIGGKA